jgi:hypothetical protein
MYEALKLGSQNEFLASDEFKPEAECRGQDKQ